MMGWSAISCLLVSGEIVFYVFGVGPSGCIFGRLGHRGGVLDRKTFFWMLLSSKRETDLGRDFESSLMTHLISFPIKLTIRSDNEKAGLCDNLPAQEAGIVISIFSTSMITLVFSADRRRS